MLHNIAEKWAQTHWYFYEMSGMYIFLFCLPEKHLPRFVRRYSRVTPFCLPVPISSAGLLWCLCVPGRAQQTALLGCDQVLYSSSTLSPSPSTVTCVMRRIPGEIFRAMRATGSSPCLCFHVWALQVNLHNLEKMCLFHKPLSLGDGRNAVTGERRPGEKPFQSVSSQDFSSDCA